MRPRRVQLPDGRIWLRVADPSWTAPLDPSYAREQGGRWNPPGSFDTLYLNGDVATARLQITRMLAGSPVDPEDLDDSSFVLVAATLPRTQTCADAATPPGLRALGLTDSYPRDAGGRPVEREACQEIGVRVHEAGLRGIWCRSALGGRGGERELAWYPATARSVARSVWEAPAPYGRWRYAEHWGDLGLDDQPDPRPLPRPRRG